MARATPGTARGTTPAIAPPARSSRALLPSAEPRRLSSSLHGVPRPFRVGLTDASPRAGRVGLVWGATADRQPVGKRQRLRTDRAPVDDALGRSRRHRART